MTNNQQECANCGHAGETDADGMVYCAFYKERRHWFMAACHNYKAV